MNKYIAELLGTFALVFCGTGAVVIDQHTNGAVTHVGVAITFGFIIMAMIYALGDISGAHIDPVVSIAFTIAKRFPVKQLLPYTIHRNGNAIICFRVFAHVFFLMLVIINVATGSKEQGMFAGLAIGSTVLLEAMFAGPICGASMNPARFISPAVVSNHIEHLWIYIVAPIAGAAFAIPIFKILHYKNHKNANSIIQ